MNIFSSKKYKAPAMSDDEQEKARLPEEMPPQVARYAPPAQRDEAREAVSRAAEVYDQVKQENHDLKDKLFQAIRGIEQRDLRINHLEVALAEERNQSSSHRAIRDEAMDEVLQWRGLVASVRALIERFETGPLPPPRRRKAAVKDNGEKLPEAAAEIVISDEPPAEKEAG